jgi:protein-L-isoaspartate(D-aspartate) O-methyltransferase
MKPMTEAHLAILRRHMVEIIDMHFDLAREEIGQSELSSRLREAMLKVPRHVYVPKSLVLLAYQDSPLPIGFDKTISQPFIGALMIELLKIAPGTRVLEVGTGLGYQAAVMTEMGAQVYSVEVVEEFALAAEALLSATGYNVPIRIGDGSRGWPEHAPFDAILVTAAAANIPGSLLDELKPGGRMVIPIGGEDVQQLCVVQKMAAGETLLDEVMPVRFARLEATG